MSRVAERGGMARDLLRRGAVGSRLFAQRPVHRGTPGNLRTGGFWPSACPPSVIRVECSGVVNSGRSASLQTGQRAGAPGTASNDQPPRPPRRRGQAPRVAFSFSSKWL